MRRISNASIYHGLRGQLPDALPSDDLAKSLVINRLHGLSPTSSDGSTFEQYLARKKKTDPPKKTLQTLSTAPSSTSSSTISDERSLAFLAMYGIDPSDIKPTAKPSGVTPECALARACMYNPDRDTTLLPPSDMDAKMYDILTPASIKTASYTVIQYQECIEDYVDLDLHDALPEAFQTVAANLVRAQELIEPELPIVSVVQHETTLPVQVVESEDEGYCTETPICTPRVRGPDTTIMDVQLKVWYTGRRRRTCRKSSMRQSVKLRRRIHKRSGVHCLTIQKYPRDIAASSLLFVER